MASFLKLLVLVPLALIAVAFAVANRQGVTVSFDPVSDVPAFALSEPLFVLIILFVVAGVVIGGVATWLGQGRHRRALRAARRDNDDLRTEVSRLKADLQLQARELHEARPYPALPGQTAA